MKLAGWILLAIVVLPCGCKRQPSRPDGVLPIHQAVGSGDLSRVRQLLATGGANPNALDRYGWTPLHRAVDQGNAAMVELLLKCGADPDAQGGPEGPPLHSAIIWGHRAVIHKLIAAGADVNLRNTTPETFYRGMTPLQCVLEYAPSIWKDEMVRMLLAEGANPDIPTDTGDTPLHRTARDGLLEVTKTFIMHGVNVDAQDAKGSTPLHYAAWGNRVEMVTFLLDHGADIDRADQVGDTPSHIAAVNGYATLFDVLRDREANLQARNDLGQTPLDCIRSPDEPNMVVLHADGQSPYEVIFTLPATVGGFLGGHGIEFDRVWTPDRSDIEDLDLEAAIRASDPAAATPHSSTEYILKNLSRYHCEYGGFLRQGRRYLVCNMHYASVDKLPYDEFTTTIMDARCDLVRVVVDLEDGRAVWIDCSY
jgi:ankyrin repeat protein